MIKRKKHGMTQDMNKRNDSVHFKPCVYSDMMLISIYVRTGWKMLLFSLLADPSINSIQTEHFDRHKQYINFEKCQSSIKWLICFFMVGNKGSFCFPAIFSFFRQIDVRVKSAF